MVLDHVLVVTDSDSWVRFTVTRWSLPLFMFCAAAVWRPLHRRRTRMLIAAAMAEAVLMPLAGINNQPGIVGLFVGLALLVDAVPVLLRFPVVTGTAALCAALYVPMGLLVPGWSGYHPALVLFWFLLGRLAAESDRFELRALGLALPAWLARVGRYPLRWYLGHLIALAGVLAAFSR